MTIKMFLCHLLFNSSLLVSLLFLSAITNQLDRAQATLSPLSISLPQTPKVIITPPHQIRPYQTELSTFYQFTKTSNSSPRANTILRLNGFYQQRKNKKQTILERERFTHHNTKRNTVMIEIIQQIKSNAAWSKRKNSLFLILFMILTAMCLITFNLWRFLGRQYVQLHI